MNLSNRASRRRRFAWRARPLAAALAAASASALALAGCGGSSSTTLTSTGGAARGSSSASDAATRAGPANSQNLQADALKFARCMRSHGISKFPDPASDGQLTITGTGINVHSPAFEGASNACQSLMPSGAGSPSGQKSDLSAAQALALAKCMRAHDVSNFPDPNAAGAIPPGTVNLNAPAVKTALQDCQPSGHPPAP
jgi:hypothetical protein